MRSGWERNKVLDIVVLPYQRELTSLPYLQNVRPRLIQTQTIGYDGLVWFLPQTWLPMPVPYMRPHSRTDLALVLASQRGLAEIIRHGPKRARRWHPS